MTTKQIYQFLKPSLDQMTLKEKKDLCGMILPGNPQKKMKPGKNENSDVPTVQDYQKILRRKHFKS